LLAAREIARGPVVGIAEAAMKTATLLATTFSVVTTLARTRIICEHLLLRYGLERHCRRVRATDLPVLELEKRNSKAREIIFEECRKAVRDDSCGAIVLGCAGMSDLAHDLSREIGVPVIEGVSAAVRLTEGLVSLGLATSKAGDLAYPVPKHYAGRLAEFAPSDLAPAIITG
jgi:allantoin racemase